MSDISVDMDYIVILLLSLKNDKFNVRKTSEYKIIESIPDCNKCVNCLDKPRNGGLGKRKQTCIIKFKKIKFLKK